MAIDTTRKAAAFARFSARHTRHTDKYLRDHFYDHACYALGICNHSTWVRLDANDKCWDKVCPSEEVPT